MKFTIVCKASSSVGLGHLIRTSAFVNQTLKKRSDIYIRYVLIGDSELAKLITHTKIEVVCAENEIEVNISEGTDVLILDMIYINRKVLLDWKKNVRKMAVISPLFNAFDLVDYYFGRTKYLQFRPQDFPLLKVYAGLQYTIVQDNCKQIGAGTYEDNLATEHFPIAIAMGGGDANNKTLEVLKALKKCKVPATFWVMVGEGYKHSINDLVDEIRTDSSHEIILAKTNSSMWRILNNCVLCILPGGITSYEAVFAGLPSINFFEQESQRFLLKEIVEHQAAWDFGLFSPETLKKIVEHIEQLYENRKLLLQMHVNTKAIIDHKGTYRILNHLIEKA